MMTDSLSVAPELFAVNWLGPEIVPSQIIAGSSSEMNE
jgi:hypothetical protein